jgi:hypothetical protein
MPIPQNDNEQLLRYLTTGRPVKYGGHTHHRLHAAMTVSAGVAYFLARAGDKMEVSPLHSLNDRCFYAAALKYDKARAGVVLARDVSDEWTDEDEGFVSGSTPYIIELCYAPEGTPNDVLNFLRPDHDEKFYTEYIELKQDIVSRNFRIDETHFAKELALKTVGVRNMNALVAALL